MDEAVISLDRYVASSMKTVHGYLTTLDARLIKALLLHQRENHIVGHLCEIGVHHGRVFQGGRAEEGIRLSPGRSLTPLPRLDMTQILLSETLQ